MATLEVHDGQGQVRRVDVTREQTVLFGSSPKCEIVLSGDGILPFHGRLRWKSNRYKVDASPDAGALEVNGRRLASSSFRQGDEIVVGPCRIFMIHADEDIASPAPRDDKTRVQPTPFVSVPTTAGPRRRRPASTRPRHEKFLDDLEILDDLEVVSPSGELTVSQPEPLEKPSKSHRGRVKPRANDSQRGLVSLFRRYFLTPAAPGEERVLTSPLVLGLVVAVVVLVGLGFALNSIIARTITTRLYQRAVESLDDGDDRNAIRRFDEFLARTSGDPTKESKARVLRALANVRQFTTSTGASWSNALTAERDMLDKVGGEPAFRDSSTELAELVLKTGEALADRAKLTASARTLSEAESALALHGEVAKAASSTQLGRSRLPAKLQDARAAVRKGAIRTQALAAMDKALQAGSAGDVYKARDTLVRQYADLSDDRDLIARMNRANDLIRRAVSFDPSRRPAETEPRSERLGVATSLVLRSKKVEESPGASPDLRVFALADGFAYGLAGGSGQPVWQIPVGLASPFAPVAIPGGSSALLVDARHDELVRIDARTGALIWRQGLEKPITDPPLVLGNQIVQTSPDGTVSLIDLVSGELRGTVRLGLPLSQSPVSDESGEYLYVPAHQDCLFVLKRDPIACEAVVYLGHKAGSIPCSPARVGRFLVIPENHALSESRWRVFVLEDKGARLRQSQVVPIPGWTWGTPASAGSIMWATGDRAGVAAYALGDYDEKAPFRLLSQLTADAKASGPAFAVARSEHELWLSGGRPGRYDLALEKGALTKAWALTGVGPALAPPQTAGALVVMTHQRLEQPGVALSALDPQTGSVRWQTVLGSGWPVALETAPGRDELTTLGNDGQPIALSKNQLRAGGFVESSLPGPGDFRVPAGAVRRLEREGFTVLVPAPEAKQLFVRSDGGKFRPIELPVALGATPLFWDGNLLIPGNDGRAYLIDPKTGESRAEPFVPPFDRTRATTWLAPAALDDNAVALVDDSGRVRRLTLMTNPRPRLVASVEVALESGPVMAPVSTGSALILATADGRIRSLAARDLSPVGAWAVEAPVATVRLTAVGRFVFATDLNGGITAFGADGQRLWSNQLQGTNCASAPAILDESAWFLTRDGSLHEYSLADGSVLDQIALNVLPAGDLRRVGPDLVVPVANGTLRPLNRLKEAARKPLTKP